MGIVEAKSSNLQEFKENHLLSGFELETHRIFGMTYEDLRHQIKKVTITKEVTAATEENLTEVIAEAKKLALRAVCTKTVRAFREYAGYFAEIEGKLDDSLKAVLVKCRRGNIGCISLVESLILIADNSEVKTRLMMIERAYHNAVRASILGKKISTETKTVSEEIHEEMSVAEVFEANGFKPDGFDVKRDGSVDGAEITTLGGLRFSEVKEKSQKLFSMLENKIVVRTNCSFHIHLSIVDARPGYSSIFQARMMRHVLNNPTIPDCVRDRWASSALDQYFNFELDKQKYRFVAFRGNTWEFRCFGNLKTNADAQICLEAAAEAYHSALTDTQAMMLPVGISFFQVAREAASNRLTFDTALERIMTRLTGDAA